MERNLYKIKEDIHQQPQETLSFYFRLLLLWLKGDFYLEWTKNKCMYNTCNIKPTQFLSGYRLINGKLEVFLKILSNNEK